ncbi:lytic polysaccharide monooxygenase [Athelia psychrophila]|uniref:lytic cellulose monooxygenase (C4-dehydrogenating) n=1 Tax=Athelia psychrophila TaxID=1759441 RepID=A0A166NIQ3_9AGAM|nr:lytic polysaccharide monooxygenase [Fibularhizoctonia sp. CBS 109695]
MRATTFSLLPISLLSLLSLVPSAASHGLVAWIGVDGKNFAGPLLAQTTKTSPIRPISTQGPVKGASNPSMFCGMNATAASEVATVAAGATVQVGWQAIDNGTWFHNVGPMMAYMASCGDVTCDKYDGTDAKWFKIMEQGLEADGKTWYQAGLQSGVVPNVTIPSNLAAGNYLLRHEIINLALAVTNGGAEFYPSCSQLTVTGSGTAKPADSELVSFPGAYKDADPGITINVYDALTSYPFPGPAVASFVSGASSNSSSSGSGSSSAAESSSKSAAAAPTKSAATSATAAPANSSPSSSATKGKCTPKSKSRRASAPVLQKKSAIPPRRHSRRAPVHRASR